MKTRVLTALIGLPLLILIIWLNGWYLFGTVIIISLIALLEYQHALKHSKEFELNYIILAILSIIIITLMRFDFYSIPFCLVSCVIILFAFEILSNNPSFSRVVYSLFFLIYIPIMLGFLVMFDNTLDGRFTIWIVFLAAFSTDTFAYFGGRALKGPKLTPISPNKTVSGSICGMIASALIVTLYGYLGQVYFDIHFSLLGYLMLGALASVIGQIGDISASLIKRTYDIKDFGKLLPGHGGVLDRFDSVIFIVPIVYIFTYYFLG